MGKEYRRRTYVKGMVGSLGSVLLYEDFEKGISFGADGDSEPEVVRDISERWMGSASMKVSEKGYTEDGFFASAYVAIPAMRSAKVAVEMFANFGTISYIKAVYISFTLYTGVKQKRIELKYVTATHKWQYLNSVAGYSDVAGANLEIDVEIWNRIRIEFDVEGGVYGALEVSGKRYELEGLKFYEAVSTEKPKTVLYIKMESAGANKPAANFDDILIDIV